MADVDGSRTFDASADELWAVVSDLARFSQWVPTMRRAEPAGQDEVHLEGESHGHRYPLDSHLGDAPGTAGELENGMEEALDRLAALISG
jgi:hypothetical protein